MNVFEDVEAHLSSCLAKLKSQGKLPDEVTPVVEAEPPRDAAHGDIATNIAMVLAKPARMKPRDIAELFKPLIEEMPEIERAEIAGPGFINMTMTPSYWGEVVSHIIQQGEAYASNGADVSEKTNVEYVSANPTGPMHVGHCRGAVFGDALANLLAFAGHKVTREYYINDAGGQITVLAQSAFLRYREALGEDIGDIPEGLYPGDYLVPVGKALADEHGKKLLGMPDSEWLPIVRQTAITSMMEMIKSDLAALNIHHDEFFSEASLQSNGKDRIAEAVDVLAGKGLIFEGRLEKPKGHDDGEWEDRTQTLFRSTQFGDDVDRALMKSDGAHTYFAADIAYHYDKLERGYERLINIFGADHIGYLKRMKSAVAALSAGKVELDIYVCQLVKLFRAGVPVKMSKRSGDFVTLRDVVDEVGVDAVRFMMLYRKNDAPLDFDFQKVTEQAKENPVYYVQYAHARTASAFRNAAVAFKDTDFSTDTLMTSDMSKLTDPGEHDLIRLLARFPRLIQGAARAGEPHRVAFYLYEVANAFHSQWSRGNDSPHLRFIQEDDEGMTVARLAMVASTQQVLRTGLGILGVHAPESMR